MRNTSRDSVIHDFLSIPSLMRRTINKKVLKCAFENIKEDISLPHFEIMNTLKENGRQHIAAIGVRLQIPKPQMTHLIDKLESLGIVVRQADEVDRRVVNITLTEKGKELIEKHDHMIRSSIEEKLSCLTERELQELSVSLRKLNEILAKLQ